MPSGTWTVLFDLDQTLVLTSALKSLRRARAWQQIYDRLHLTQLPPGTLDFLRKARFFAQLGIVTNTPRPYAEKLVAYHHLAIPVVVAYHDTQLHKPHPAPLLAALARLHANSSNCCYVGDRSDDLQAALSARVIPIGLCWDNSLDSSWETTLGRSLCSNWNDVLTTFKQLLQEREA